MGGVGGVLPSAAMYRYNYMFLLIMYVCNACVSVCLWYVSMCVSQQGRHVIVFCVCTQRLLHVHIMFPPPPVGGLGGSYHLQPCIGITICFCWFMYDNYLFVWFMVCCMYVYTCPSKVDMSLFLCLHTKILHVHIMFPPPPCGWVGGVLPSAGMYRYNYMFLLIYVW